MKLFLSEFITSGALSGAELPPTLASEGRAMRDALIADFARLPDVEIVMTCDARLPAPGPARGQTMQHPLEERDWFERLCRECDAVYLVAPELDGILSERCRIARRLSPRPLNGDPDAVEVCADKYALWLRLREAAVPTIPTCLVDWTDLASAWRIVNEHSRCGGVLKPRYGAGSQSTWLCRAPEEAASHRSEFDDVRPTGQAILQPCLRGRALSVAAIVDTAGAVRTLFPPAEQHLSGDGTFRYLGGGLPAADVPLDQLETLIQQAAKCVPGLRGYVGFDLLELSPQDERPGMPAGASRLCLVEINPRLTTSYIGYRRLTGDNLAAAVLDPDTTPPPRWNAAEIEFTSDGIVHRR